MNMLSLDLSDPDIAAALKDCADGEQVEFTVSGTLKKSDKSATVDLDEVKYTGTEDSAAAPDEAEPTEPPKPKAKKMAPAVADYTPPTE